ncbi:MAG: CDP-alcohol phosphatidyltransferase family protein, partial [Bacteroidetes bacterium]|nr:CDP-alcohol phosphatidyltransferase family protein [Bacteroidota bacterium]
MDGPVSRSLILIFMAGFTDFLDGMIARSTNTISGWGKILDPAADKFSVVLLGAALVWKNLLPFWFLGAIVIRDVFIVAGGTFLTHRLGRIHMSNLVG